MDAHMDSIGNWLTTTTVQNSQSRLDQIDRVCDFMHELLPADSAAFRCFEVHVELATQFNFNQQTSLAAKQFERAWQISKTIGQDKPHLPAKLIWYLQFAGFHYANSDLDSMEKYINLAEEEYANIKDDTYLLNLLMLKVCLLYSQQKYQEALEVVQKIDAMEGPNLMSDWSDRLRSQLKLYKGLVYEYNNMLDKALVHYKSANEDSLLQNSAFKYYTPIYYAKGLCQLGRRAEGLKLFKDFKEQIDSSDNTAAKLSFYAYHIDCLQDNGQLKEALEKYSTYSDLQKQWYLARKKEAVLEVEAKFKASEKEAEILRLEKEQSIQQSSYNTRLATLGFFSLIGIGLLSFFLNRNRIRQRQLSLVMERDRLIAENRDRLFTSISHDIRTPLALMLAPLERAHDKTEQPQVQADIQLARQNGKRLMELFNQILDWNKAEAKALQFNEQIGELRLALHNLSERYTQQAIEKGIRFRSHLALEEGQYALDYDKLDKILSNLLSNAIKFCEPGHKIELSATLSDDQKLLLKVQDDGPGIPIDEQAHLYEHYFQGKIGKNKGGSGIGLALVKELTQIINGQLQLTSAEGQGCTFELELPIRPVAEMVPPQIKQENHPTEIAEEDQQKPLLLLIEDEQALSQFLQSALADTYEITLAQSANVGYAIACSRIPDLIITDWVLPDYNGGWLCRQIRNNELTAHIPIVVLTAYSDESHKQMALEAGAIAWMSKPFQLDLLSKQLEAILHQQRYNRMMWKQKLAETADKTSPEVAPKDQFVQKTMHLIGQKMGEENFSVEKMAQALFLSRVQLFRKLKNLTGKSPSQLLREERLKKAHHLLKHTNQSIAEIAFSVGFSDPNYFSTAYKQFFKRSPRQDQQNK
ncbi:MAG: ATP-binding protein [Bacteroidota bacterium]